MNLTINAVAFHYIFFNCRFDKYIQVIDDTQICRLIEKHNTDHDRGTENWEQEIKVFKKWSGKGE